LISDELYLDRYVLRNCYGVSTYYTGSTVSKVQVVEGYVELEVQDRELNEYRKLEEYRE